jgi:putative SOS response-associated peptidase YedK
MYKFIVIIAAAMRPFPAASHLCGAVAKGIASFLDGMNVRDSRVHNYPPRWNGAPSQDLLVIRRNHKTGEVSLDPLRWGLIPYCCEDPKGGRKPINAKCETVRTLPSFREAYRKRRCILPVDGFFEWRAIKGQKAKHRREPVWDRRFVGKLARPDIRRVDAHLRDHHSGRQ